MHKLLITDGGLGYWDCWILVWLLITSLQLTRNSSTQCLKGKRSVKSNIPSFLGKQSPETKASWEIIGMQIFVKWWLLNRGSIFAVEQCSRKKDNRTKMFGAGGREVILRGGQHNLGSKVKNLCGAFNM
nr:hypothetical protein CFP56_73436 [Quercus suber]